MHSELSWWGIGLCFCIVDRSDTNRGLEVVFVYGNAAIKRHLRSPAK